MFFYLVFVNHKRIAATFALIAVTLAFFFAIVLVGLTANGIQVDNAVGGSLLDPTTYQLISAILALALFIMALCIAFFIIYICVYFSSSTCRPTKY
jgi:hypothetical protein